ncbi:MxaH protein [Methylorubrum populi]|uniref:MxaH protein n=1 Tax=Methylobacterium radiotolerans TaxID=31998 RepID=A0ABU7T9M4_9HYPH
MRPLAAGLAALLILSACDRGGDSAGETSSGETSSAAGEGQVVASTAEDHLPDWLTPTDGTDPARWLAGREAGRPLPAEAAEVRGLRDSLDRARSAFVEDRRMIANRTVQLGQMLAEIGKPEPYRGLIDGLGAIASLRGRHKSLYGEMCQHYYNTRAQGADHATALARLEARERPQEPPQDKSDAAPQERSGERP